MDKKEQLLGAIYYMKIDELRFQHEILGLDGKGLKQVLIAKILNLLGIEHAEDKKIRGKQNLFSGSSSHASDVLLKGRYRNNRHYRSIFTDKIGPHFKFTAYGMEWIKKKWSDGIDPTVDEFCAYWQAEYERRAKGGDFKSPTTLQRVKFFRAMKGKELSKAELEKQWKEKRELQANLAIALIKHLSKNKNG